MTGNNVLFTFDSVIDVHLGLLKHIKESFNSDKFMKQDVLNNDEHFFKILLLSDKNVNPITQLLLDDKKEQADSIYEAFMKKEYNNILNHATRTDLYNMLLAFMAAGNGAIRVRVLCRNELEQHYINRINSNIPTVIGELHTIDLAPYDSIYIKNIRDLLPIDTLEAKNLYILSYLNNFEKDDVTPLMQAAIMFGDVNIMRFVDAYSDMKMPVG